MPITYRLSPWFYVAFSCQGWLMSQRGLVLSFPLLKHQRQRSLWFIDPSCSYTAQQQLSTAVYRECPSVCQFQFDDCVFGTSVQKIRQFKPIFSMPLKWNTRWGPLSPSVDTTAGTKPWPNVALSPYQRTCLEDECVQQRGIIDQLQETESADLGTFPREDDNYLKIMNDISSSVSLKLRSVEHSRCSPQAMWVKWHYMSTFRFCPTNRIKKRPASMVCVCLYMCVWACMLACEWLLGSARSFSFVRV